VEESKEEIRQEMEELDPDELVPVSFQGQMRPSPKGLTATLLPFQVEGVSWMHHQEVTGEAGVRGGMLADEVRSNLVAHDLSRVILTSRYGTDGYGKNNPDDHNYP
jgi:DNA repair protein RAD16